MPMTLYYTYSFSNIPLFLLPRVLCTCCDLGRLHCTLKVVSQGFLLILQSSASLPTCLRSSSLIFSFRFPHGLRLSKRFALFPSWCQAHNSCFHSNSITCCLMSSSLYKKSNMNRYNNSFITRPKPLPDCVRYILSAQQNLFFFFLERGGP